MLGSPLHEEKATPSLSFQYGDDVKLGSFELGSIMMLCGQEEKPPSFTGGEVMADSYAQYQFYQQQQDDCSVSVIHNNHQQLYAEEQYFTGNSIQNNGSSLMHGQHQIYHYQQEIGGVCFGAQEWRNDGAVVLAGGYVRTSHGDTADGVAQDQKDRCTACEDEDRWRWAPAQPQHDLIWTPEQQQLLRRSYAGLGGRGEVEQSSWALNPTSTAHVELFNSTLGGLDFNE